MEENNNIKVLDKALRILDVIRQSSRPLGVNELARSCGLSPATAFRMLKTLKNGNWVYQDSNEKYIIGTKISFVTEKNNFWIALKETAYFIMTKYSLYENQAMNLVVRDTDKCFILEQSHSKKTIDYVPPVGTVLHAHASACGKVLLSELSEDMRNNILGGGELKKFTDYTITNRTKLSNELAQIRKNGFALDEHESQEEGFCIAVAVKSISGETFAALSFSGFIGEKSREEVAHYVSVLKKASSEITDRLFKN